MVLLALDEQHDPECIKEIIAALDDIKMGKIEQWQGGDNAYFCEPSLQGAQVETAYDVGEDEIPLVTLSDFGVAKGL